MRKMVRIAFFSTLTFAVILFLMGWMELGDVTSSLINQLTYFILILVMNFIALFIIYQLYDRNVRDVKLTFYAFFLVSILGSVPMMLNDQLIAYLMEKRIVLHDTKPHLHNVSFVLYAILQSALVTFFVVTWQVLVLSQNEKMRIGLENAALKTANSQAVNQLLLQQIHPHFFFNALATVKSLIHKQPEVASNYLVKLSNFLRTSMSSMNISTATLAKEINFCSDYLELQKVRLGDALFYTINIDESVSANTFLPVFTLQLLVENAIKHNSFSEEEPMHIEIKEADGIVTVINDYRPNNDKEHSLGSGLTNLKERYHTLTGGEINVQIGQSNFYVSLNLITSEDNNHRG
jgi:two-component system LytT family sensor kinase